MKLRNTLLSIAFLAPMFFLSAQKNDVYLSGDSLIKLGIELHDQEKYEDALKYYSEVNPNDESYPLSRYEKALTYNAMGKNEEALQELQFMQKYPKSLDLNYYNLLGSVLDILNRQEEALKVFESVYPRYEHTALLPYNYGVTFYRAGKLNEARTVLEKNVRTNPYHFNSHIALGKVHYAQGRLVPALLCFAYASTINESRQASFRAFNCFDQALDGTLEKEIKTESGLNIANSADDELNLPFKELEYMLQSYLAGNKNFALKIKLDYKTTRQLQFLIENVKADPQKTDVFNQQYIPFFNQLIQANQTAPYLYFFTRFSENKNIVKQVNKNKGAIQKYIQWAVKAIDSGREQLFDPKNTTHYTFNRMGVESKGNYADDQKKIKSGNWIFYHNNGEKGAEGAMLNDKKEGVWVYYSKKGELSSKEVYKDGEVEGELVAYNSNSTTSKKINYKHGKEEGESVYFNHAGFIQSKMTMKEDEIDGLYTYYYDNESTCYTLQYTNGKRNGTYTVYNPNNTHSPKKTGHYKDDVLDGETTIFYLTGSKQSEDNYKNGKTVGTQKTWHANGQLEREYTTNEEEKITGFYKVYHSNGQLSDSVFYKNGIPQGTGYFYARDGKLHFTLLYDSKGKWDKITFYDKSGKIAGTDKKEGNKLNLRFLDPNGKLVRKSLYKDNEAEGEWEYYDFYGNVTEKRNYKTGELDGERTLFYGATGKISQQSFYKDGKLAGLYTQYHTNGNILSQGYFADDAREGEWKYYYSNGKISSVNFYKEGEFSGLQNYFSFEGKKSRDEFYENEVINRITYYNRNEEILDSCSFTNGYGKLLLKYPNGKIYRECESVKNGKYNGTFTIYNVKGEVTNQCFLVDGMYDGKRTGYNDDKEKIREDDYLMDNLHGTTKYYEKGKVTCEIEYFLDTPVRLTNYYPNGKKSFECAYNDDSEREGWASAYDELSGELQYEMLYEKGVQVGYRYLEKDGNKVEKQLAKGQQQVIAYYQNGNKSLEMTITNGWREGKYTRWHANGKIEFESSYLNNDLTGEYKKYSPAGVLTEHGFYQDDDLHGILKKYSDKGVLLSEEEYVDGSLHGTCKYYQANGKLRFTRTYNEGVLVAEK